MKDLAPTKSMKKPFQVVAGFLNQRELRPSQEAVEIYISHDSTAFLRVFFPWSSMVMNAREWSWMIIYIRSSLSCFLFCFHETHQQYDAVFCGHFAQFASPIISENRLLSKHENCLKPSNPRQVWRQQKQPAAASCFWPLVIATCQDHHGGPSSIGQFVVCHIMVTIPELVVYRTKIRKPSDFLEFLCKNTHIIHIWISNSHIYSTYRNHVKTMVCCDASLKILRSFHHKLRRCASVASGSKAAGSSLSCTPCGALHVLGTACTMDIIYIYILYIYPLVNKHRPWQNGVGRLVSIKNWWFSGSWLINMSLYIVWSCMTYQ